MASKPPPNPFWPTAGQVLVLTQWPGDPLAALVNGQEKPPQKTVINIKLVNIRADELSQCTQGLKRDDKCTRHTNTKGIEGCAEVISALEFPQPSPVQSFGTAAPSRLSLPCEGFD